MKQPSTAFALKGTICFSTDQNHLSLYENSYVICERGRCAGVFPEIPGRFSGIPVRDTGNSLIIPGLVDLHLHAPQYAFRGMHMDLELLDWLNTVTFPEEARYQEPTAFLQKICVRVPPPELLFLVLSTENPQYF